MQTFRRSVLAVIAVTVALSLSAAPREPQKTHQPRQTQQKDGSMSPWMRLIHKLLDDVIPPPDNKLSVPPG